MVARIALESYLGIFIASHFQAYLADITLISTNGNPKRWRNHFYIMDDLSAAISNSQWSTICLVHQANIGLAT